MAINFGITSSLAIDQNLTVGGTAQVTSALTLSNTTASSLLYGNASKAVASVTLSSNLSLTTGTLALAAALTGINSITSTAASTLVLATGTFGTAVTFASATGVPTFSAGAVFAGGLSGITTLSASGVVTLTNTTASTSTTTGALQVAGGVGVVGSIYSGGGVNVVAPAAQGGVSISNTAANQASIYFRASDVANVDWRQHYTAGGILDFDDGAGTNILRLTKAVGVSIPIATASTSTTTGSLINAGGFGNLGAGWFGGSIFQPALAADAGIFLTAAGGNSVVELFRNGSNNYGRIIVKNAGVAVIDFNGSTGAATFAGAVTVSSTTEAAVGGTGALIVSGGIYSAKATVSNRWETVTGTTTYAATTDIDMTGTTGMTTVSLTNSITFTTSNRGSGRGKVIRIISDGSSRTLTFPAGWVFVGSSAPTAIAASKTGILSIVFWGSNDTDCVAAWSVQS